MGNAQGTPEEPIDVDVLIIGAGATGLGAAYRLNQLGLESWALVDANGNPGGSSGSVKTSEGFRFDLGVQQIPTKSDHQFFETLKTKVRGHKLAPKSKEYKIVNHSGDADLLADYFSHATNLGRVSASANVVAGETTFDQWLVEQFGEKDAAMYHRPLYNKKYSFPASQIPASYSKVLVTNPTEAAVAVEEVEGAVKATARSKLILFYKNTLFRKHTIFERTVYQKLAEKNSCTQAKVGKAIFTKQSLNLCQATNSDSKPKS